MSYLFTHTYITFRVILMELLIFRQLTNSYVPYYLLEMDIEIPLVVLASYRHWSHQYTDKESL